MKNKRIERIGAEIQRDISMMISQEIKDHRIDPALTSIIEVRVTNDLGHANIYLSVFGDESRKQETLEGFEKAKGYIKRRLGETLSLRHIPDLHFKLDESIERGMYMNALIQKTKEEDESRRVEHEEGN